MKIEYNIPMIGDKYLIREMADGWYYFLFDLTDENLKSRPPQLLTDEEILEFSEEFKFFDTNTDIEYSSLDIVFRNVVLEI